MPNKVLLSLATVAFFAATAKATTVETTNSWFTTAAVAVNWTGDGVVVSNGTDVVCVDTAADNAATNSISAMPSGVSNVRITGRIANLCLNASVPAEYSGTLPQASITAVDGDTDAWYVWHCTNPTQGAWVQMTGATPEEGNPYGITIEFKNGYVRYAVDGTWLTNNENQWITNAQDFAAITKVGLAGFGQFGKVAGLTFESFEVNVNTETLTDAGFSAEDAETILAGLNEKGANGLPRWQSLVLGLNPTIATEKPYTAPVQTANGNIGFTIGNVNTDKYITSDATVSFEVEEYSDAACTERTDTSSVSANAGSTAEVAAPNGVKYYKIKIKITK